MGPVGRRVTDENSDLDSPALEEEQAEGNALRREGQLAGVLFIVAPVVSLPSSFLIEPAPPASIYLLSLVGILTGLVCLALPWERMGRGWLQLMGAIATVEVTVAAAIADRSYVFFYLFIVVYAAYIARRRLELAGQLGLIALGLLAPLVYDPGSARETLLIALVALPSLVISAGMVMYLREQLDADRRAYRRFAVEALTLTSRIRGKPEPLAEPVPSVAIPSLPADARRRAAFTPRRLALGAAAFLVSLPLLSVGLAAAGVSLQGVARAPFEELGITLPIRKMVPSRRPAPARRASSPRPPGRRAPRMAGAAGERTPRVRAGARTTAGAEAPTAGAEKRSPPRRGPRPPPPRPPRAPAWVPRLAAAPSPSAPTPGSPGGGLQDTIDDRLRDTLGPVGDLLRGLRLNQP